MALRMVTHRIDLGRQVGQSKRTSRQTAQPIYDCARYLLDHDLAEESDTIETYRSDMRCMFGRVGDCAKWTVKERDKRGLQIEPFELFGDGDTLPDEERLAA